MRREVMMGQGRRGEVMMGQGRRER